MRYTIPEIKQSNNNLYIEFYLQKKRYRYRSDRDLPISITGKGNREKDKKQRKIYFQTLASEIHQLLKGGWSPIQDQVQKLDSIHQILRQAIESKRPEVSTATIDDYEGRTNILLSSIPKNATLNQARSLVIRFLKSYQGTNHNNYLRAFKILFNQALKDEIITNNPITDIPKKKANPKSNKAYPSELAREILAYTQEKYPDLHLLMLIEYYCFIRPTEIHRLKIEDITETHITIWSDNAKVTSHRTIPIHPKLKPLLAAREGHEGYLFKYRTKDYYQNQFKRMRKKIDIPSGYTIYSFKHTGVCALYKATKDLFLVSKLCGHTSTRTTEIYLRSLGLDPDFLDNSALPEL